MNPMTCEQVEEQLDLLAAGECDRSTRRAVEQHLESCAACSASYADSQRLQGLLQLHWNEAAQLDRLRQRLDEVDRQTRRMGRRTLPWMNRAAALAALLLVTFGLALFLPQGTEEAPRSDLMLTAVAMRTGFFGPEMKMGPARAMADVAVAPLDGKAIMVTLPKRQSGEAYRHELRDLQHDGHLPLPPFIPLGLELKNKGPRSLEIYFGHRTELSLDVQGPGVLRLATNKGWEPMSLWPRTLRLAPGERRWLAIEHLVAKSWKGLEYVYLTEPGDYTLTVRLRTPVSPEPVELTSGMIRVHVVSE